MTIRARDELTALEAAGRVVAKALAAMKAALRPGVTTGELDADRRRGVRVVLTRS